MLFFDYPADKSPMDVEIAITKRAKPFSFNTFTKEKLFISMMFGSYFIIRYNGFLSLSADFHGFVIKTKKGTRIIGTFGISPFIWLFFLAKSLIFCLPEKQYLYALIFLALITGLFLVTDFVMTKIRFKNKTAIIEMLENLFNEDWFYSFL